MTKSLYGLVGRAIANCSGFLSDFTKIFPTIIYHYFYNTLTGSLTIAQVTSQLNNIITSLSTVFETITGTVQNISQTFGSLTASVQIALSSLNLTTVQLVKTIFYISSIESPNIYEQVNKDVASRVFGVAISSQELINAMSEVTAIVLADFACETKAIEAVSALCIVLYTALKVVLHVVIMVSDLLTQLNSEVFGILHAVITILTAAVKSVTTIIVKISQSTMSATGTVSGFSSNVSYIATSLAELSSKFIVKQENYRYKALWTRILAL